MTASETVPILGITYEVSGHDQTTRTHTGHVGQCQECSTPAWLSQKRGEYLCHSCYYGVGSEPDPIVDDIRRNLTSTWWEFYRMITEQALTLQDAARETEGLEEMICPDCTQEAGPEEFLKLMGTHICPDCQEDALEVLG